MRDALAVYLRNVRDIGRKDTAWEAGQRFLLTVPRKGRFGTTKLEDLTREDAEKWRKDLKKSLPHCRGVIDPVAFFETESLS